MRNLYRRRLVGLVAADFRRVAQMVRAIHENANHACDFNSNLFKGKNVSAVQIRPLRFSDAYSNHFWIRLLILSPIGIM